MEIISPYVIGKELLSRKSPKSQLIKNRKEIRQNVRHQGSFCTKSPTSEKECLINPYPPDGGGGEERGGISKNEYLILNEKGELQQKNVYDKNIAAASPVSIVRKYTLMDKHNHDMPPTFEGRQSMVDLERKYLALYLYIC
jgi:hypothetical protein